MVFAGILALGMIPFSNALAKSDKLSSVGVTVIDLGNPFFVALGRGAEAMAREFGGKGMKVSVVSAGNDLKQQVSQMENFASAGTQIILLNAADSKGIAPAVNRAKDAGAIVIAVDVAAEGGVDATVTSDNKQAGEMAAEYIAARLHGKGNVVILNGPPVTSVQDRISGAVSVFEKYPGIKILSQDQNAGGTRDGGLRVMTDLLAAHPKIDAVFAENDPEGIGTDLAARQAQRKELFIVGVDGSPDGEAALMDKTSLFAATIAQNPYVMAAKAVEIGHGLLHDRKPEQATTLIPVRLVTRESVSDYKGWTRR
jgi:ribose transport system substrate-binding protein